MANAPPTNTTGQIVKASDAAATILGMLEKNKNQIQRALPRHVTADRMARVVTTSLRRTPKLLKCKPLSLLSAIMQAAQLGLEPDNGLGHAYLVPFKDEVVFIPGYKGLIDLARRSGQVSTIYAVVVRRGDDFSYELGDTPRIIHKPSEARETTQVTKTKRVDGKDVQVTETVDVDRPITHVYAVCRLRDGGVQREVMTIDQVDRIRSRSAAANDGPWVTDTEEMIKKTCLRRLCKMLPASIELQRAVALDEENAAGLPQSFEFNAADIMDAEIVEPTPPAEAQGTLPVTP